MDVFFKESTGPEYPRRYMKMDSGLIHPRSSFMRLWNMIMVFAIIICIGFVPFQIAFSYKPDMLWAIIMTFVDIFFLLDIFVNFRVAVFDDADELVQDKWFIAKRYWKGWFIVDFVSSISSILVIVAATKSLSMLKNFRILRLFRLVKLVKAAKISHLLTNLDGVADEIDVAVKLSKLLCLLLGATHLLGCAFYVIGVDESSNDERNWVDSNFHAGLPIEERYLVAWYWAFVTVTTVGYGDILPLSANEQLFAIFVTFMGTSIFGYMIGEVSTLASKKHASEVAFAKRMASVEEFMRFKKFPLNLRQKLRKYYGMIWRRGVWFNEDKILGDLSPELCREVKLYLTKGILKSVPFLRSGSDELISMLVCKLSPLVVTLGTVIIQAGEIGQVMYFLNDGEVEVELIANEKADAKDDMIRFRLQKGIFFGEIALLSHDRVRSSTVRATKVCELFTLAREDFYMVVQHFPSFAKSISEIAQKRRRRSARNIDLTRECSMYSARISATSSDSNFCNSHNHGNMNCPGSRAEMLAGKEITYLQRIPMPRSYSRQVSSLTDEGQIRNEKLTAHQSVPVEPVDKLDTTYQGGSSSFATQYVKTSQQIKQLRAEMKMHRSQFEKNLSGVLNALTCRDNGSKKDKVMPESGIDKDDEVYDLLLDVYKMQYEPVTSLTANT